MPKTSDPMIEMERVSQRNGHDCGPAVARAILRHFRRPVARVDDVLRPDPQEGTPPDRLVKLFLLAGLGVAARSGLSLGHLRQLVGAGWPVLCPVQMKGEGHWVVVRGLKGGRVYLMDPADHADDVADAEFVDGWHDKVTGGPALVRFGLAVYDYAAP